MNEVDCSNVDSECFEVSNQKNYTKIILVIVGILVIGFFIFSFFSERDDLDNSQMVLDSSEEYSGEAMPSLEMYQNYLLLEIDLNCRMMNGEDFDLYLIAENHNIKIDEYDQLREKYDDSEQFRDDLFVGMDAICPPEFEEDNFTGLEN